MSATRDYVSKKWVDWIVTLLISIITIGVTFNLDFIGSLASKNYVDTEIKNVNIRIDSRERETETKINSIRSEQTVQYSTILKLLESIDNRTKRLEDNN